MTLGEGKRKVLMLMDEYSSGGTLSEDRDLDLRMKDFFDLAQKHVAGYKRIVREVVPETGGWYGMPEDFGQVFRVWLDGRLTRKHRWKDRAVYLPADEVGRVTVEYFAVPGIIPADAGEDYVFEVAEDAAACMPYFVAAQQLMVDLIVDPAPLMELYDRMLSMLDTRLPESGGGGVRQSFYR